MTVAYGIVSLISLVLIGVCLAVDRKKYILLRMMFVSVFICNLGHFLVSKAPELSFALNANRLAYLGQVFLPFLLMMMILKLCNLKYPQKLPVVLLVISFAVLCITLTPGLYPWYYKNVSIETVDGFTRLVRDYGPLHSLYFVYLLLYFFAMLAAIVYAALTKKIRSSLHIVFLLCAVLCNIAIWLVEQFLPRGFEVLTVSYIMSELFILLLYGILQEDGLVAGDGSLVIMHEANKPVTDFTPSDSWGGTGEISLFSSVDIDRISSDKTISTLLTARENEVLRLLLMNKQRKEIAQDLYVSENTIKKHTSSIFRKLEVKNRYELFAKLKSHI